MALKEYNNNSSSNNDNINVNKSTNTVVTGTNKEELAKQVKDGNPNQEVEIPTNLPKNDPYNPNVGLRDPGSEGEVPDASNSTNPPTTPTTTSVTSTTVANGKTVVTPKTNTKSANSNENPFVVRGEDLYKVKEMHSIGGFAGASGVEYKNGDIVSGGKFHGQLERFLALGDIELIPGQAY